MNNESLVLEENPNCKFRISPNESVHKLILGGIEKSNPLRGLNKMGSDTFTSHAGYYRQIFDTTPEAILIFDEHNKIIDSNSGFCKMFLYENSELSGKYLDEIITPSNLIDETRKIIFELHRGAYVRKETTRISKDGRTINVLISGSKLELENGKTGIYLTYIDISVQKMFEEQIKSSLIEKELLIREVHHRVKNNLQIISSLLKLQSKSKAEKSTDEMFIECQNRVKAISLIHEKLYQTNNITRIDFDRYIKSLSINIMNAFGINPSRIKIYTKVENVFLTMDTAIPCGLIINELVTNSIKHAFENGADGDIHIEMKYDNENRFALTVKDNGKGLPDNIDVEKSVTMGFTLIQTLIKQLDAKLEIKRNQGTEFKITFSISKNRGGNN